MLDTASFQSSEELLDLEVQDSHFHSHVKVFWISEVRDSIFYSRVNKFRVLEQLCTIPLK
jgi:hypothetical protein